MVRELGQIRGRHTELVSVYIPSGHNINDVITQLFTEKSTASNIKSKNTRKNVLTALEKITQHLRLFKQTPTNGLVVFCGNISPIEGKEDIRIWSFEPPIKMTQRIYWCDQTFVLDPLRDLVAEKEVYALIAIDAREATIGLLRGKRLEIVKKMESAVPSKSVKGGMCVGGDSFIQLEDGNAIPIKELSDGQKLLTYSFSNYSPTFSLPDEIFKRRVRKAYKLILKHPSNSLTITGEHKVFVMGKDGIEEKFVEDLKEGEMLLKVLNSKLITSKIVKKIPVQLNEDFYDLFVPETNSFVANGIVVHNSQSRYDGIREDAINEFFTKVGEIASEVFLKEKNLSGLIIGGPGPNKERFHKEKYLNYQIQNKILGVKDIGYTGEEGLEELVNRSQDIMQQAAITKERELMQKFFTELKTEGNVVYGFTETEEALGLGAVENLLLSEDFDWVHVKLKCSSCGNEARKSLPENVAAKQKCEMCGQQMAVEETKELIDVLSEKAVESGARVEYVSTATPEGRQFKELGGVGAFLRYKLKKD